MKRMNTVTKSVFTAAAIISSLLWLNLSPGIAGEAGPGRGNASERRLEGIVADQYIVTFHDDVSNPRDLANALGQWHGFAPRKVFQYALKGFAARMPAAVARALAADPDVAMVEPDVYAHTSAQTIPTGVARIGAAPNPTALDCSSVDVAIIDTGIDLDHPDLNVVAGKNFNAANNVGDGNDDNGHGTHVAGIVGAKNNEIGVVGVCPGARLWAIKVLDSSGSGTFADIIEGVDYVTANAKQIKVANMSLAGVGYLASFRTAVQNSVNAGVVYVVAAGNSAMDVYGANGRLDTASDYNAFLCAFLGVSCGDDVMPAAYPEVATISALSDTDGQPGGIGAAPIVTTYGPDDSFATFSNYSNSVTAGNPVASPGRAIDLLMPGVDILSTFLDSGYALGSGTSMASPHAAGLAARYILANGRANNAAGVHAIRQALINGGVAQNSANGLTSLNDRDVYWENIGWAGAPPPVLPGISINDVSQNEGNSGVVANFNFTVSLSASAAQTVTVNFTTASGTASAGSDYVASSGTLTFNPGETSKTITVQVTGDNTDEPNETFYVNLSGASANAYIADGQGLGTIVNDDTPATVQVFADSFEGSLATNWTQDSQNDWFRSNQRKKPGTTGSFSAEVDGLATDAKLTSIAINLQGKRNATITFSWYIESGLDAGEYIAFDVSTDNGATWTQRAILRGNVDAENTWHNVTVDLTNIDNLKIQFRGRMSDSSEDANVDDVKVVAY